MSSRPPGSHALLFILITVLIETLGFGIMFPVLPSLIAELGGVSISEAAGYGGALMFVYAFMHFLSAPVLGNLSDRFGRRPVLLLSLGTLGVDYLIMGFATSLGWLFLGRTLAGASAATFATANAYIADITPEQDRAARFGIIGAVFSIGFVLGPALGGLLIELGPRAPFHAAALLALINVTYGLIVLPETLPVDRRRPFRLARANPIGAIHALRQYSVVTTLFFACVLYYMAHDVNPSTWTYYVLHKFSWSQRDVGLALAAVGLSGAVVSGGLVGPMVRRFGEMRAAVGGLLLASLSFLGYALATDGWMLFPFIAIGAFMGLVMPSLRGIMSRAVHEDQQGELQGALASVMGLTAIVSPLVMTQTFRLFSAAEAPVYFPGASFALAAILCLLAIPIIRLAVSRQAAPAD